MRLLDAQPIRYLLRAPTISSNFPNGSSTSIPFQSYSDSLREQIAGRTPLLHDVLYTVEYRIQVLRDDLDTMRGQDEDTR
jgi:conserved oligomeric Golgi complex subunit 1